MPGHFATAGKRGRPQKQGHQCSLTLTADSGKGERQHDLNALEDVKSLQLAHGTVFVCGDQKDDGTPCLKQHRLHYIFDPAKDKASHKWVAVRNTTKEAPVTKAKR